MLSKCILIDNKVCQCICLNLILTVVLLILTYMHSHGLEIYFKLLPANADSSSVINADTVELVVATLTKDEEDADRERLQVESGVPVSYSVVF